MCMVKPDTNTGKQTKLNVSVTGNRAGGRDMEFVGYGDVIKVKGLF